MSYAKIIDGQALAEKIKDQIVKEILALNNNKPDCLNRPNLAIILVGEREDSKLYVSLKEREAKKVGIDTHIYRCPEKTKEKEILEIIDCLNKDELIDGILVQLPLPEGFHTDKIIKFMDPKKDVDRFHPENIKTLMSSCESGHMLPPVPGTVLEILKSINYDLADKKVCLIVNSDIFGRSLGKILECQKAKVKIVKAADENLSEETSQADILITAVGQPKFIKKEMVKEEAVVIDIGITKEDKKVYGDVDFAEVKDKVSYITPVPGGVGPMTIAMLFKNTLELYKKQKIKDKR
ncbi:MAG: bifunctional 5,10-methylenetetrahydrofolate dehydrogenase/5,10-methenyltetrahydrofolate cyclohydrolase [Patescibacteria group bacterium]|nr:bifunctional 5,10-methylenetetrahydrofolate dehydrogenase/5,10-methenyltetrahydrofolate cyclohydrolase [Patescibacteria group bacterium]